MRSNSIHNMYSSPMSSLTGDDLTFLADGAMSDDGEAWEEDTETCGRCGAKFGENLKLLRRHHCRICGRCICAACSPSKVLLEGQKALQRACTPCVSYAYKGPMVKKRLAQLSTRIYSLASVSVPPPEPKSLEEATVLCETALISCEEAHVALETRSENAEANLVIQQQAHQEQAAQVFYARDFILQLGERLHALHGGAAPRAPQLCNLEEAAAFCEAALGPLKQAVSKAKDTRTPLCRSWSTPPVDAAAGERSRSAPRSGRVMERELAAAREAAKSVCEDKTPMQQALTDPTSSGESIGSREVYNRKSSRSDPEMLCDSWEDGNSCSICEARLGKRHLRPRHHCRICGRCVCSGCSPSSIRLEGKKDPQRVCTPCISSVEKAPTMRRRMLHLAERLQILSGVAEPRALPPGDLEQALSLCEASIAPLINRRG